MKTALEPLKMSVLVRCWPRPWLSVILLVLWLLLVNSLSLGQILLGALWAWLIPFCTHAFWPGVMKLRKPVLAMQFLLRVMWDVLIANCQLVPLLLGKVSKLNPAFIVLPLDIQEDFTITLLASTISLTPGTVSADLSEDRKFLLIHALNVVDEQLAIQEMKQRYERPLKEIFEC